MSILDVASTPSVDSSKVADTDVDKAGSLGMEGRIGPSKPTAFRDQFDERRSHYRDDSMADQAGLFSKDNANVVQNDDQPAMLDHGELIVNDVESSVVNASRIQMGLLGTDLGADSYGEEEKALRDTSLPVLAENEVIDGHVAQDHAIIATLSPAHIIETRVAGNVHHNPKIYSGLNDSSDDDVRLATTPTEALPSNNRNTWITHLGVPQSQGVTGENGKTMASPSPTTGTEHVALFETRERGVLRGNTPQLNTFGSYAEVEPTPSNTVLDPAGTKNPFPKILPIEQAALTSLNPIFKEESISKALSPQIELYDASRIVRSDNAVPKGTLLIASEESSVLLTPSASLNAASNMFGSVSSDPATTGRFVLDVQFGRAAWHAGITERVAQMAASNLQFADIQLDPPELGPVHVRLQINSEHAHVAFNAHNASVREALDQHSARLREMFHDEGYTSVDVDVSDRHPSQEDEGNNEHTGGENPTSADGDNVEADPLVVAHDTLQHLQFSQGIDDFV